MLTPRLLPRSRKLASPGPGLGICTSRAPGRPRAHLHVRPRTATRGPRNPRMASSLLCCTAELSPPHRADAETEAREAEWLASGRRPSRARVRIQIRHPRVPPSRHRRPSKRQPVLLRSLLMIATAIVTVVTTTTTVITITTIMSIAICESVDQFPCQTGDSHPLRGKA